MKHFLNTLYVTQSGTYLHRVNSTIVIERDKVKIGQFPVHTIGQILCTGYGVMVSPALMQLCSENGISIAWMTESGRFLGRVEGEKSGNVLLRREQYRWADDSEKAAGIACSMVAAKINNARINLLRLLRNHPEILKREVVEYAIQYLASILRRLEKNPEVATIRGLEGEGAAFYFNVFDHSIVQQKTDFRFDKRSRRPPLDAMNALLSYGYSILAHDCQSALEAVGLDPFVGFLHVDRPGRPSLALDLMEEFRHPLVDRLVLGLVNLGKVKARDFDKKDTGEVRMSADCRKQFITAYQERKRDSIKHPFLEEGMEIGLLFVVQARLLARHIRGDTDFYPAMIWR